jgi:hypothetical protein
MSMAALPLPRRTRGRDSLFFMFRRGAAAADVQPRWTSVPFIMTQ